LAVPYCSKECQTKHLKKFSISKSAAFGTLKNHECAVIIQGASTTKRPKEKEVYLISGNDTEQIAGLLYERLITTKERRNRKYFTSKEVQSFISNEIPDNIKPKDKLIYRAAWRIMNKCKQMHPNEISFGGNGKSSREIEVIK